jgi:2-polyprenyl-6-methoxyphenol hydroxylase-like FAD-dependent oxidoreductase
MGGDGRQSKWRCGKDAMSNVPGRIVVVGAGPTGLTLALLLAQTGVHVTLVERNTAPQAHPAACILDTRSMEVFRETGQADRIIAESQSPFERAGITWVTNLAERELGRCSALPTDVDALLAASPTHATVFPQNRLEPILWEAVRETPLIDFRIGHALLDMEEGADGVTCTLEAGGRRMEVSADYVVGCDGTTSPVRRLAGIGHDGRIIQHMIGVYFTADLGHLVDHRKSILYWTLNPDALGVLIAHWLPVEWVLFVPYYPPQQTAESYTESRCRSLIEHAVGFAPPDLEIKLVRPWSLGASVAARYRQGRVLLAGDAAHSFPPTGGLGLNTGVQDAHNLAWKLAAVLRAEAGSELLDTYEMERRPVARINLEHSVANFEQMSDLLDIVGLSLKQQERLQAAQNSAIFTSLPPRWQRNAINIALRQALGPLRILSEASGRGEHARHEFHRRLPAQARHYRFAGLDLGFAYERGAVIPDGTERPVAADPVIDYRPTTWPGSRLPHFAGETDGVAMSIHDVLLPNGLTLLVGPHAAPAWRQAVRHATAMLRMPVACIAVGNGTDADFRDPGSAWPALSEVGRDGAVLVRPDGHVAWRIHGLPDDPGGSLDEALRRLLSLPEASRAAESA